MNKLDGILRELEEEIDYQNVKFNQNSIDIVEYSSFINKAKLKAKQAIIDWVCEDIIGRNYPDTGDEMFKYLNTTLEQQRQKLKEVY